MEPAQAGAQAAATRQDTPAPEANTASSSEDDASSSGSKESSRSEEASGSDINSDEATSNPQGGKAAGTMSSAMCISNGEEMSEGRPGQQLEDQQLECSHRGKGPGQVRGTLHIYPP